ncbi:MAG: hypothetical protein J6M10_08865, partial [Clostridia bacterium]|nr:hypothetical protein [Clostridia bacterium]
MRKMTAWLFVCILLVASCACAERNIIVPDGYVQGEPLPVYRAIPRSEDESSFYDRADPAWFNESGV